MEQFSINNNLNGSDKKSEPSMPGILLKLLFFVLILAAILFLAAGRWNWVMGWITMAMYTCVAIIGVLVVPLDPGLVEERTQVKEGVKAWDKRITLVGSLLYPLAIIIIAGLDTRISWSINIPSALQLALGSLWTLIPGGLFAVLLVIRTILEDQMLQDGLQDYLEYSREEPYRLIPYLW